MNLYEAISVRKSIREFDKREVEEKLIEKLKRFSKELQPVFLEVPHRIVFHNAKEETPVKKGKFCVEAPFYISVLSEDSKEGQINAGYLMEQMVLFLTCRGVATCYQGNLRFFKECAEEEPLKELAVVAVGYPVHYLYREENLAKRVPLAKQCHFKEEVEAPMMAILKAANLAPSALNQQPWRFVVYGNRIHVMTRKETVLSKRFRIRYFIDTGIALAHMEIAADELWLDMEWKVLENIQNQNLKRNHYTITMMIK